MLKFYNVLQSSSNRDSATNHFNKKFTGRNQTGKDIPKKLFKNNKG